MGKSQPRPTDPRQTSAAQTGSAVSTGISNAYLQNMNEITPDGTRTFDQTGNQSITDPYTGQTYNVPRFTLTETLSDSQQAIKDQNDAASLNLASLGNNLSGQLGSQLTDNFTLNNESTEARLMDLGSRRLDPMFAQRDEDLRTRLSNQGIKAGSEAYDREMMNFQQGRNDAYNQLLLTGRGQAAQEQLTEDNQRINQIGALLTGGQVSQPTFNSSAGIGGINQTDNAAIIANADNARMSAYNSRQQMLGSALGAAGGLFAGV